MEVVCMKCGSSMLDYGYMYECPYCNTSVQEYEVYYSTDVLVYDDDEDEY